MSTKQKYSKTKRTVEIIDAVSNNAFGTKDFNALLVPIIADIAMSLAMIVDKLYEEKTDEVSD